MVVMVLVVILQNDLGQAIVLGVVVLLMLLFAGGSLRLFGILSSGAFMFAVVFIASSGYRRTKVIQWYAGIQDQILKIFPDSVASFLRVETSSFDQGYQVMQASNAMAHGGIFGVGIGGGTLKLGFVSDIHTDFVLAGIIEETGIFGALAVSFLILGIVHRILKIANRTMNPIHYLFSIGIAVMLSVQFAMNALGIVGVAPVKGITVPFISYGGSSLVALALGIGMIISMSKDQSAVVGDDQNPSQTIP
jgi:cell division protein FtsW